MKNTELSHEAFTLLEGELFCEDLPLEKIARSVPTPFYVYSSACLRDRFRRFDRAFSSVPHLICYALKANSQPALLRKLVDEGAGAEVVSGAELELALQVGFSPEKIVFSGTGKTDSELEAGLGADILFFIAESEGELVALERLAARANRLARVSIRINPDIDPLTHPHISTGIRTAKFGLDPETALQLTARLREFPHLEWKGIHAHIGSQLTSIEPFEVCARLLQNLAEELKAGGAPLTEVDFGGGLGICYRDEEAPSFEDYARLVLPWISRSSLRLILEPGRALIGPAGALVARVLNLKRVHGRRFAVVDAGMNDFLRPALYDAYHRIVPLVPLVPRSGVDEPLDVVGPVCESSDVFGRDRRLGDLRPGDRLAILDTGAYGYVMSSNYNLRPRPAEVVVEGESYQVVRRAETTEALVARELGRG